MATPCFRPTPSWHQALKEPGCPRHLVLVAEDDGQVVGWCRLFPENCRESVGQAELGIGLLRRYRGRGLGTALVDEALRWTVGQGISRVTLTVRPDNDPATGLFEKCGFAQTGREADGWLEMACRPELTGG